MTKIILIVITLLMNCLQLFGQHNGLSFQEAEKQGISIKYLDSIYTSAVHSDTSLAVFKTETEQVALQKSYIKFLQDFGEFLSENNFVWEKPTKCFNRIYIDTNGTIDFFLFNFLGKATEKPEENVEKEFQRLLNIFISDYTFTLIAKTRFSQCSPTCYMPQK